LEVRVGGATPTFGIPTSDHDAGALSSGDSDATSSGCPLNHDVERPMAVVTVSQEAADSISTTL